WADMSHLIPEEEWPGPVRSVGYFCSVLPDPVSENGLTRELHADELERVRANAVRFLNEQVQALWPRAVGPDGAFRWDVLATENGSHQSGEDRFRTQHWAANVNPTDRYALSVPGSIEYRLSPLDMTFDNLTIAGDWTASGLDTGCIESAVMSGMLAAHALSHEPRLEDIIGYDHP